MQAKELDTASAGRYAAAAAVSARVNSYAASTHYTAQQRHTAECVKLMLGEAYAGTVYLTYRKRFAAVKIADARVRNTKLLKELEADYVQRGYTKAVTPQGVVYRIPK